jgi:hypothetical protein
MLFASSPPFSARAETLTARGPKDSSPNARPNANSNTRLNATAHPNAHPNNNPNNNPSPHPQPNATQVYGRAAIGAPPMSVPHLDWRTIYGKDCIFFGPFAGFRSAAPPQP